VGPALLLWMGGLIGWAASPNMSQMVREGRYRLAVKSASAALERSPDDADAMAILGAAWSKAGHHGDAVGAFALVAGSAWYEDFGLEPHADSVRALGDGERAATMHLERIGAGDLPFGRELRMRLDVIDDLREAGDPWGALDAADVARALAPRSPAVHAVIADCWLDLGDEAEAEFALWRSRQLGGTTRGHLVAGRVALRSGHPEEALDWARKAGKFRSNSLRVFALEAEALRQVGRLDEAFEVLSRTRPRLSDDPEVTAVRLRVLAERHQWRKLADEEARARAMFSRSRVVIEALDWLESSAPDR
jgi:tetratricopeptide (TPR) repeat protein